MRWQMTDLDRLLNQLRRVWTMGPLQRLVLMLPGFRRTSAQYAARLRGDPLFVPFVKVEAIILSMTPDERRHPEIIDGRRRKRIARGSGTTAWDVYQLLKVVSGPTARR
jgi:signal recognition particle subunit SRP54